jgi:hypothetical protein
MPAYERALVAVAVAFVAVACEAPPEFTTPLSDPGTAEVDRRLIGTWYGVSQCRLPGGDVGPCGATTGRPALLMTLDITTAPGNEGLLVRATALALDVGDFERGSQEMARGRALRIEATARPTMVNGVIYYSVRRRPGVGYDYTGTGEQPHFLIAQAELADADTLYLRVLSKESVPGELGRFREVRTRDLSYAIVDAPRDRLVALLSAPDQASPFTHSLGPFRRLSSSLDAAGLETESCEPDEARRAPRFVAVVQVANALARVGLKAQARDAVRLAADIAAAGLRPLRYGDANPGSLAEAQVLAGDPGAARATLVRYRKEPGFYPSEPYFRALTRVGDAAEAVTTAARLPYPAGGILRDIAVIQAEGGDFAGALRTAHEVREGSLLADIAAALAERGDAAGARRLFAQAAPAAGDDVRTILEIARKQMKWGYSDDALDTVRIALSGAGDPDQVKDPKVAWRLFQVAEIQADAGDRDGAGRSLAPMLRILEPEDSGQWTALPTLRLALHRIVALQVKLGDRAGARHTLERILAYVDDRRTQLSQFEAIGEPALAYAANGDSRRAIEMAGSLGTFALYEIALVQRDSGDAEGLRRTLKLALERQQAEKEAAGLSAFSLEGGLRRIRFHADAGDPDGAAYYVALGLESARQTGPLTARVERLLTVADVQVQIGDRGGARSTALYAFAVARDMPALEPCDSNPLLAILTVPDLEPAPEDASPGPAPGPCPEGGKPAPGGAASADHD